MQKAGYPMSRRVCMDCGRIYQDTARKCYPCNNTGLVDKYCTIDHRVAEYFAILTRCELWPSMTTSTPRTLSEIAAQFKVAATAHGHQCAAKNNCPLIRELVHLQYGIQVSLNGLKGISMK